MGKVWIGRREGGWEKKRCGEREGIERREGCEEEGGK